MEHLRKALACCKYPKWVLDKVEKRLNKPSSEVSNGADSQGTAGTQPTTNEVKTTGHIVIPYTQGLSESIKKICSRYGIQTHFKGNSTIKNLLLSPRTRIPWPTKVGPSTGSNVGTFHAMMNIYVKPGTFGGRFKEHLKETSSIHQYSINTGHPTT